MKLLLIHEVAKKLGVHVNTVRKWEREGFIKAKRNYRGYRVFEEEEVLKAKAKLGELQDAGKITLVKKKGEK